MPKLDVRLKFLWLDLLFRVFLVSEKNWLAVWCDSSLFVILGYYFLFCYFMQGLLLEVPCYRTKSFSLSNTQSQIGDSLIQADSQHLYCKLLIVFVVMKMALAISWCRLQAPAVILYDSLLKGTVGRDLFHAHTGRKNTTHSLFYPDTCTSEIQWQYNALTVCVGTLTRPHDNSFPFPYAILPDIQLVQVFSSYIRGFL